MPLGMSRKTVLKRRTRSSSSPATAGGACDDPAPGSSKRRLCIDLSGPAGPPTSSSLGCLPTRSGLSCSHCAVALNTSTSRLRGATSAHAPNKQTKDGIIVYTSNIYTSLSKNHKINHNTKIHDIPLWSKTSPGGSTISGSPRKSTPA